MAEFMDSVDDLKLAMSEARELNAAATVALERAETQFQRAIENALDVPFKCSVPPSAHRRDHKPGRAAKLDTERELQAFVRARLSRMTFEGIADDVAQTFPPDRRIGKSAIHA
ncbi:MAG: hypothetical protein RI571_13960 [Roseovarius sp.]|nr:hypothetical protein [Roseovarius sp.]